MRTNLTRRRPAWVRAILVVASLALTAGFLGVGSSAVAEDGASTANVDTAIVELDDCWDEDAPPVRNLRNVSQVTINNRTKVVLTWEESEDPGWFANYRVSYVSDWRPQKYMVLKTSETSVTISGLWPGRTYTFFVQPNGNSQSSCLGELFGEGWGVPVGVEVTTPSTPKYRADSPWVVSLGDSFISGEGGRWAGNSDLLDGLRSGTDTGERAYYDYASGEVIEGCHRSRAAMIHILVAKSMNFACSGAITSSAYDDDVRPNKSGDNPEKWKPGVDSNIFPNVDLPFEGQEAIGQTEMLRRFAEDHNVKMVVLSIGGNNFYFSDIVTNCVLGYALGSWCSEDERLAHYLTEEWQSKVRGEVKIAIQNIVWAMRAAGYDESQWTLVQTFYPKPIATSDVMRYPDIAINPVTGSVDYPRQYQGGCGFWDDDADWAINTVLPTVNQTIAEAALEAKAYFEGRLRLVQLDNSNAFRGHELCNIGVKRVNSSNSEDRGGVKSWHSKKASDKSEWMKDIDISNFSATTKNEGFHPGYWGQLALRNCLREVWNGGDVVSGGICTPTRGRNQYGEPNMEFKRESTLTHVNQQDS